MFLLCEMSFFETANKRGRNALNINTTKHRVITGKWHGCHFKQTGRNYTPLYKKDTKQNQNKPMETTFLSLPFYKMLKSLHEENDIILTSKV